MSPAAGRLFALADLHLSLSGAKPMDIFGAAWVQHHVRMAEAWDDTVADDDTVLLPGDLSWAKSIDEAEPDLEWIGARPGRKLLLRGNHDGWWSSLSRVRRALPEGCIPLQHDAHEVGDLVVVGARGWLAPDDPIANERDASIFHRELERLRLSIRDADSRLPRERPRVAMLHYPPWIVGREPTAVVEVLREAGVRLVVYGHLHGDDHSMGVVGEHDGIRFELVAADAIGFAPRELRV